MVGVHFLQKSGAPLPPLDLSQGGGDATIVQLRVEELKPTANRLTASAQHRAARIATERHHNRKARTAPSAECFTHTGPAPPGNDDDPPPF